MIRLVISLSEVVQLYVEYTVLTLVQEYVARPQILVINSLLMDQLKSFNDLPQKVFGLVQIHWPILHVLFERP